MGKIFRFIKMALSLAVVAVFMAVACPQPVSPDPTEPEPSVVKSLERRQFELCAVEGIYIKNVCAVGYDESSFQKAVCTDRNCYRIQADDQEQYLNVSFSGKVPSAKDEEVTCKLTYRVSGGGETILVIKFVLVKLENDMMWLWNELQKTGIIVPVM